MDDFLQALHQRPLLVDGAMGTLLYAQAMEAQDIGFDQCLEALVVAQPERIAAIHTAYVRAGADVITTHTFGANAGRLAHFGRQDQVRAFNQAAVTLAQQVRAAATRPVWIAGNVGPVGRKIAWNNQVRQEIRTIFATQIDALASRGVDLLLFETFSDVMELTLAVGVARELCALPIVAAMSYGEDQRTLAGQDVEEVTARLVAAGADVVGANCSVGPAQMVTTLTRMRDAAPHVPLYIAPNAGLPVVGERGAMCYPIAAADYARYVAEYLALGARLVGGCCGTTPEYTAAMRRVMDDFARGDAH